LRGDVEGVVGQVEEGERLGEEEEEEAGEEEAEE